MEDEKIDIKTKKDKKKENDKIIKNIVELNPKLKEEKSTTAVFTFGRMNPPTIGHEKLVNKILSVAKQNDATPYVYLSQSYDSKKNPLPYKTKISLAKKAFGDFVTESSSKNIIQVAKELQDKGYKNIIFVGGSDRINEFQTLLNKYNGKDFTFDSIEAVSAGKRDPDSDGAEGMSASKMREAVRDGDEAAFKSGLPKKLQSNAKSVFDTVKNGMKIAEEMETELGEESLEEVLDLAQRRKRAIAFRKAKSKILRGRKIAQGRMATKDKLEVRARKKAIQLIRKKVAGERGSNYADLSPSEKIMIDKQVEKRKGAIGKIAKRLMPKVTAAERERLKAFRSSKSEEMTNDILNIVMETYFDLHVNEEIETAQDPDIDDRKGSQPSTFYKGIKTKSTKASRDRLFSKQAKMKDDDPKAYQKAPGDATTKTQPSQYTKRYHQLFSKENTVKFDGRFRFLKPKKMVEEAELFEEIDDILNELFEEMLLEKAENGLKTKAEKSGIPYSILKKVYDRGMAAWKVGHKPGANQQQWAYARVNSFITGGRTRVKGDPDLWDQVQKMKKEEVKHDKCGTPDCCGMCETATQSIEESFTAMISDTMFAKDFSEHQVKGGFELHPSVQPVDESGIVFMLHKKEYKHAADVLRKVLVKKADENKTVGYWAAEIAKQYRPGIIDPRRLAQMMKEEHGAGDEGTDELVRKYKKDTPGQ